MDTQHNSPVLNQLPASGLDVLAWTWEDYTPFASAVEVADLAQVDIGTWLSGWTAVSDLIQEHGARLRNLSNADTRDEAKRAALRDFIEKIVPNAMQWNQNLKEKLLATGNIPDGMEQAILQMKAETERFRAENLPLLSDEQKHVQEYDAVTGAVMAELDGETYTLSALRPIIASVDREKRKQAWEAANTAFHAERAKLGEIWANLVDLRVKVAENAGCGSYTEYIWPLKHRFDYSPADCQGFHQAVLEVVVPALAARHARQARLLGLDSFRPWDVTADPLGREALRPFHDCSKLESTVAGIFDRLDPELGGWFGLLRDGQLDLPNRQGKAPGGWCSDYPVIKKPYIFMNAVGVHDDVQTLLHEAGHAFHGFSTYHLPYGHQRNSPMEFCEVASMAMELIAAPYLDQAQGGFYNSADAARARTEHLERVLTIWVNVAIGDAFQHWIYDNPSIARDAAACSQKFGELYADYMPAIDFSGFEDWRDFGWQRTLHYFVVPHYYIEYGIAQLGAVQVMAASQKDAAGSLASYKKALRLGGTVPLPKLFETAGARFAMDKPIFELCTGVIKGQFEALGAV